jgi:hypothetical protein
MTPVNRPEILAPGNEAAETAGKELWSKGDAGVDPAGEERTAEVGNGVVGADPLRDGLAASTTHILCDRVATSLATVCASVEYGLTWNTSRTSSSITGKDDINTHLGMNPFHHQFHAPSESLI